METNLTEEAIQAEVAGIFELQQRHAPKLNRSASRERIQRLRRLEEYILNEAKMEGLFQAMYKDFRKPKAEVLLSEIAVVLQHLRHTRKHLRRWMQPRRAATPLMLFGVSSAVQYEAKGTCLILSPWNYPFNLTFSPLVDALAAGNTVIIKPSEISSHTSRFIRKVVEDLFPTEEVAVVEGDVHAAQALLELPFDHIFFTGSPQVGKIVMAAAAKNLTSLTLELGGKSPALVDDTADLPSLALRMVWGKGLNVGQSCIAPDYVLVQESQKEAFVEAYQQAIRTLYPVEDLAQSPDYARIINQRNFQRLRRLYEDALAKGAKEALGGTWNENDLFIPFTLLTDVHPEMEIMEEEIFGPLLPVVTFRHVQEAVEIINRQPKPLTLYIGSKDRKFTEFVLEHTSSGSVVVNDFMLSFGNPELGFGGVNNSGIGRYMGHAGFLEFSNPKPVLRRRFFDFSVAYPPYTNAKLKLLRFVGRWLA
ncbi:MAG: Aldehyde dehydrogenase [Haliscomenobacter sp.]|jgi:aldehyde dehydrogenase (NAD+)|nr:Aldehyde dehydrogenase [Haliscomenobacter sp.]